MTREKYESLPLATLRELAKARKMKGISTLKKGDLIEAMLAQDDKEKQEEANAQAKEEVKEEIKTETKEKIVICMLKRGKSTLEEIAADTQMPIEQVERIKKEQQL